MDRNENLTRDDGEAANEQESRCMIVELPQEVLSIITSFQYHKDRIFLSEVCPELWQAVELFSEKKLEDSKYETQLGDAHRRPIFNRNRNAKATRAPPPVPAVEGSLFASFTLWVVRRTHNAVFVMDCTRCPTRKASLVAMKRALFACGILQKSKVI